MSWRGLEIEKPHIFNLPILITSSSWALLGSKLFIIFSMSQFMNSTVDTEFAVYLSHLHGSLLPLSTNAY